MLETARQGRAAGLKNVVISAGFINPEPLRALCAAVDSVKIATCAVSKPQRAQRAQRTIENLCALCVLCGEFHPTARGAIQKGEEMAQVAKL